MAEINLTTKNATQTTRIQNAFEGMHPIPVDDKGAPRHTSAEWVKLKISEFVSNKVIHFEERQAKEAISITEVNDMIS